jgi:hypothetical protein
MPDDMLILVCGIGVVAAFAFMGAIVVHWLSERGTRRRPKS